MRDLLKRTRRIIVVAKFTMSRGYVWCQTPTMAIIGVGVVKPYLPNIPFLVLVLIVAAIFMGVGFLDRHLKFLNEELSYTTEKNTKLMYELNKK